MTVVGDPQLEFNVSTPDGAEFASYLSGSGTKELVFSYTVLAVDDDEDGIWWGHDTIKLDIDDSITGVVNGLDALLDHSERGKLEDHRIDQNPRAVSQEVTSDPVGGTDSDTYGAGDAITFEVVFNQILTVSGSPRLRFSITGPGDEYATYVSGSGTNTLVFSYTVLATEMDPDGIYLYKNPLDYPDANVDSIVGTSNNLPAVNDGIGEEGALSGHKVDGSITDDAAAGKVTLELTPATINESGTGNASTVTASIPSASSAATTVTVSVNPADTTTLTVNTILTIPAGDTNSTGVVTITAVNDDAVTGNRTVAVSGTAVNSVGVTDPDVVTLTITDDDTAATGDPLVRGERKVGSTLTGDTKGIADGDGLTNPGFIYQWQRMEDGMSEDIPGAVSETYTLTDDVGKRVRLQVRFNDDEGTAEMRTGPATSVITKAPHLLVGNLTQNPNGHAQMPGEKLPVQSTGFNTGMHRFGYVIDSATAYRGKGTPVNDGEAEIRIHGSTSEANAIDRRPVAGVLVVAASDLTRQNGLIVDYSARSRAKLNPSTTYHLLVAALDDDDEPHSCRAALEIWPETSILPKPSFS